MSEEHHLPPPKPAHDPERDFASYAWRLIGTLRSQAGWLDLTAGRLRYSTPDGVVFDVPLAEVTDITWPWYYFGGGVKLTAGGEQYRFSFVLPNGAEYPTARTAAAAGDPVVPDDRLAEGGRHRRRSQGRQGVAAAARRRGAGRPGRSASGLVGSLRASQPALEVSSSRSPDSMRRDQACWCPVRDLPSRSMGSRKNPSAISWNGADHSSRSCTGTTSSMAKVCAGV